jgi:glycosyltransferase involved in cell wall biosynthesis
MDDVVGATPAPPRRSTGPRRPGRPRVVEVSTYPLHPKQTGGELRGWHLAEALAHDAEADVTVVSLTTDPGHAGRFETAEHFREICVLLDSDHARREAQLRLVTGTVSITDVAAGLMWAGVEGLLPELERELDGAAAAVLVQPYLVDPVATLASGLTIVCDEHNDEFVLKRAMYPLNHGGRWLLSHVDRLERAAVEDAALVTATTQEDLDALADRYRIAAPTAVVPNGVDTSGIQFVTGEDRRARRQALASQLGSSAARPKVVFVGSGHLPNIEAGRTIVEVARELPGIDFVLAGRHSELLGLSHVPRNVRLLGPVPADLLDLLLSGADLAVNPMDTGSGSNLKLLNYLASGLPVVSTVVGARGIDASAAGVHTVEHHDLAAGIRHAVDHPDEERPLAGRRYVEEHCDWRAIGRRFASLTAEHLHT